MKLAARSVDVGSWSGGLLAIGRFADAEPTAAEAALDDALEGALARSADRTRFKGRPGQTVLVDTLGKLPAEAICIIGLGKPDDCGPAELRDFAAAAISAANTGGHDTVAIELPAVGDAVTTARDLASGAVLGAYRYDELKSEDPDDPRHRIEAVEILGGPDIEPAVQTGQALGDAVCLARTLVNEPPNVCNPVRLGDLAAEMAKRYGFEANILGLEEIRAMGMGGIVGVGQGSKNPPRFIHLHYEPEGGGDEAKALAFVGKGITFDSGGLSLKPPKSMADMYIDMAGSAAVFGAMQAVGELKPSIPVHGIVGAAENMPGGAAYRPSDVLTMYSGKTVEVLNTDAEGRLVLADCLHYACDTIKPRAVVNLATLTGACMVGLGDHFAGLFSSSDALADELLDAAKASGEAIWHMPLDSKLKATLKSKRADIKNIGGPWGGAITAALFLREFVDDRPWAHLDIAGPAHTEKGDGHIRPGGTGFGVLTLWGLVEAASQ